MENQEIQIQGKEFDLWIAVYAAEWLRSSRFPEQGPDPVQEAVRVANRAVLALRKYRQDGHPHVGEVFHTATDL